MRNGPEKLWKVIRGLGLFALSEALILAETEEAASRAWLKVLLGAGYVREEGRRGKEKMYRLVRNTGPMAPEAKTMQLLFDPNTTDCWCEDIGLKCPASRGRIPADKRDLARNLLETGKPYRDVARILGVSVGSIHNIRKEMKGDVD